MTDNDEFEPEAVTSIRGPGLTPPSGDNSAAALTRAAKEKLGQVIARVERLNEEIAGLNSDKKDVFAEAKAMGYDAKTLRWLVSERKIDRQTREERDMLRATYAHAVDLEFYD